VDAARWRRPLHRIGGYPERFGACRHRSRRTQIADEVQLGRLPAANLCVFLLLSGKTRYVPAHIRAHQIWLDDRANNAKAAVYSEDDLMILERDIGHGRHG
jgi:hypothetical protein